jgi:hypothetical protein
MVSQLKQRFVGGPGIEALATDRKSLIATLSPPQQQVIASIDKQLAELRSGGTDILTVASHLYGANLGYEDVRKSIIATTLWESRALFPAVPVAEAPLNGAHQEDPAYSGEHHRIG